MSCWAHWHCTVKTPSSWRCSEKPFVPIVLKRELKTLNNSSTSNQTKPNCSFLNKIPFNSVREREHSPKMALSPSQGWWLTRSFALGARKCNSGKMMKLNFVKQGTKLKQSRSTTFLTNPFDNGQSRVNLADLNRTWKGRKGSVCKFYNCECYKI